MAPRKNNPLRAELDSVLAEFRRDVPSRVARIMEHFAADRLKEMRKELHTLAGSAGTFGLPHVSKAARAAVDYLDSGGKKELGSLLRKLEAQARDLRPNWN